MLPFFTKINQDLSIIKVDKTISFTHITDINDIYRNIILKNTFLPNKCLNWIVNETKIYQHLHIINDIHLHIISDKEISINDLNHIILIIKWISGFTNKQKLNIYIYPTPFKKIIDKHGKTLTKDEINSGVTYKLENWIQIFRKEELHKVLIHELIHYFELDIINQDYIEELDKLIPANKCFPMYINEAFTEALAIYLNTWYYSYFSKTNFDDNLKKEISYSKTLFHIILYHYNINYPKELINICQKTNVISYYIIKYLLIKDPNIFYQLTNNPYPFLNNVINNFMNSKKLLNVYNKQIEETIKSKGYYFSAKMSRLDISNLSLS